MQVELIEPDALKPYARNARTHSDEQIEQIARSLKEFGFVNPILADADNTIIAGHGRLLAAKKLGIDKVPVVRVEHLTEAQRRAYTIADNRLALDAAWDYMMLGVELQDIALGGVDINLLGFSDDELATIERVGSLEPGGVVDQQRLDELDPKLVTCPHCGTQFDVRQATTEVEN